MLFENVAPSRIDDAVQEKAGQRPSARITVRGVTTQTLGTVLAEGVADARAGRWTSLSLLDLLDEPAPGDGQSESLARHAPVLATRTWRSQWGSVPEEHRVRALTVMLVASRHPLHPCLAVRRTVFSHVYAVGLGNGLSAALGPLPDGTILWMALVSDDDLR